MTEKVTGKDVRERFEEAARTLRALPDKDRPRGWQSAWPDVVKSAVEAYGYDPAQAPRLTPDPAQISRMEECFTWLSWLEPRERKIVWLYAEGVPRKVIAGRVGCDRTWTWRLWVAALETIANRLNQPRRTRRKGGTQARPATPPEGDEVATVHNPDEKSDQSNKIGRDKSNEYLHYES